MDLVEYKKVMSEFEGKYPDLFEAKKTEFMNKAHARILKVGEYHNTSIILERKYGAMKIYTEDEELKGYIKSVSKDIMEEEMAWMMADLILTMYINETEGGDNGNQKGIHD